jgi:hypothetical protein
MGGGALGEGEGEVLGDDEVVDVVVRESVHL